jgi:hypothetical protein
MALAGLTVAAMLSTVAPAKATINVTVDPGAAWLGFMNVFELPENGGGFVFGSPWGPADLIATFDGPVLTLRPNSIGDPDPFWYQGGGGPGAPGNKIMEANMYVEETGPLSGDTVIFSGEVLTNTLVSGYTSVAFIKDFAPDYSSFEQITLPLAPGPFSISLDTIADPARHVQFGFQTVGPNVWITDNEAMGAVQVTVPEPSTMLLCLGLIGACALRRR